MSVKKLLKFLRKNYFIPVISIAILFVGLVFAYKVAFQKPIYLYAKIKVGQGLWWAATQRPPVWLVNSINKGDVSYGLLGSAQAKVLSKRYYRYYGSDQYDIYLTMKLKVGYNKKTGGYTFSRSILSVGSAVDIQFPREEVTGIVIALSDKPFKYNLVEKTIYLSKRGALPWELDAIKIGDTYFDGENKIFEVIDKSGIETTNLTSDSFGNSTTNLSEPRNYVTVKAKVKLRHVNGQLVLGEDHLVAPGRGLSISTPSFVFDNYIVSKIE